MATAQYIEGFAVENKNNLRALNTRLRLIQPDGTKEFEAIPYSSRTTGYALEFGFKIVEAHNTLNDLETSVIDTEGIPLEKEITVVLDRYREKIEREKQHILNAIPGAHESLQEELKYHPITKGQVRVIPKDIPFSDLFYRQGAHEQYDGKFEEHWK